MAMKKIQVFVRSNFEEDCPVFTGNSLTVTYRTPANTNYYNGTSMTFIAPQEPALIVWDGQEIIAAFSEYLYWKKIES